jgi:para-aminobenzoate synthetase component I
LRWEQSGATGNVFRKQHHDWVFGCLSYDLKNELEPSLRSSNFDGLQQPALHFFVPKYLVKIDNGKVELGVPDKSVLDEFRLFLNSPQSIVHSPQQKSVTINHRLSATDYIKTIHKIKHHIQLGDIYELNFCQEFYAENAEIHPVSVFQKLNEISKAPFTCFFKNEGNYLMCASPERFLKRQHNTLISQPIKGTRKRIKNRKADNLLKQQLFFDEKERSENVMIVDLVRNDFSKIAVQNSVEVEELFGIYTFEQVHQMISTVSCTIPSERTFAEIMQAVFPMGSMTGAPKLSAMQLIERYELTKRGLFSGAVGYITPKGNFDFNVVIRSILYNSANRYVSVQAGSAITTDCDAETEYEECLLKAKAMLEALK